MLRSRYDGFLSYEFGDLFRIFIIEREPFCSDHGFRNISRTSFEPAVPKHEILYDTALKLFAAGIFLDIGRYRVLDRHGMIL